MYGIVLFFGILIFCLINFVWKKLKNRRERKEVEEHDKEYFFGQKASLEEDRDSIVYDKEGNLRFGNLPYKYSNRTRGVTIGEQYVKAGGVVNPSVIERPQFVPGRESYKTILRSESVKVKKSLGKSGSVGEDSLVFGSGVKGGGEHDMLKVSAFE